VRRQQERLWRLTPVSWHGKPLALSLSPVAHLLSSFESERQWVRKTENAASFFSVSSILRMGSLPCTRRTAQEVDKEALTSRIRMWGSVSEIAKLLTKYSWLLAERRLSRLPVKASRMICNLSRIATPERKRQSQYLLAYFAPRAEQNWFNLLGGANAFSY
jgi:hypothetical protein